MRHIDGFYHFDEIYPEGISRADTQYAETDGSDEESGFGEEQKKAA